MIYLDQAATSFPKPAAVVEAVCSALSTLGNSGRAGHNLSLAAGRLVFAARSGLAHFFGAEDPAQIAFTANGTESLNIALPGVLAKGDHVLTTELEHNSVLRPLYYLQTKGVEVSIVPTVKGRLNLAALQTYLRPNTKALVCTHASNVTGNVLDLDYLGEFCRGNGLLLIVDAAQTAGSLPIHVQKQGIDILCFTGHKGLCGPQGVGGIYVKSGLEIRPLKRGGSGMQSFSPTHPAKMPAALEAGTLNTPGIAGLLAGVRYLNEKGLHNIQAKEAKLTRHFYSGVRKMGGIKIYGDFDNPVRCPIVSLNVGDLEAGLISDVLAEKHEIYTRPGAHCAPLVHKALGTTRQGVVRFSFSHLNTIEELDLALGALAGIVERFAVR